MYRFSPFGHKFQRLALFALAGALSATGYGQTVTDFGAAIPVSTGTTTLTVQVPFQTGGQASSIRVVTAGLADKDFTTSDEGTCATGTFLAGQSCSISVTFSPKAPGERVGAVVLMNGGTVLGTQLLHGSGKGSVGVFLPGTVSTVAGNSSFNYAGDGGDARSSPIFIPSGVVVDPAGNIYLSDTNNNRVRRVDAVTHVITTVAGDGTTGVTGDGGPAVSAPVNYPTALVLNGAGDLYIADTRNNAIRKLTLATGILSTIAGRLGVPGSSGDGGSATLATLNAPGGLAMDAAGFLYIADTGNDTIRRIDPSTGMITLFAGIPTVADFAGDGGPASAGRFNNPLGLAIDSGGSLYIADQANHRIRMITAGGSLSTVAGTGVPRYNGDGGLAVAAQLQQPAAVAVDVARNLYIADSNNHLVRKVSSTTGLISSIVGIPGAAAYSGDNGPANVAKINGPYALALDSAGDLYFADLLNNRIRKVSNSYATLQYTPIRVGRTSAPQSQTFENDGNDSLIFTAIAPDADSATDPGTTSCAIVTPLDKNDTCVVGAEFKPQTVGAVVTAEIQLQSNASNSPGIIHLSGEADALEPTTVALQTSGSPSALGAAITFTATVKITSGVGTSPVGTVTFLDGTTQIGTGTLNGTGVTTFTTSALALGSHDITAHYGGDTQNAPSTSAVLTQIVKQGPSVVLTASPNPSLVGDSVLFSAKVTTSTIQPSGLVAFKDGATSIGSGSLNGSGVATFATTALVAGSHSITASYVGDANTLSGTSVAVTQVVNKWTTTTTLTSSATPSDIGTPVTFTITVTPTSTTTPTGSVTLQDGAATIATQPLVNGVATFTTSTLTVGSHLLVARFPGDATNDVSGSSTFTQVVRQIATGTALTSSPNPSAGGATVRFTATVTAATNAIAGAINGTVTFKEGPTVLGTGTLSTGGIVTLDVSTLTVGTHQVIATYSGNTNYATSSSSTLNQVVQLATTTVALTSSVNPSIAGSSITLTAVASGTGGIPTGAITFFDGTLNLGTINLNASGQANLTLSNLSTGSHSITASYAGDTKDNPSISSPLIQVVKQATTALTLTTSGSPAFLGTQVTFIATLSSNGTIPAGQIVLTEGATVLGTTTMSATGVARFMLNTLTAGSHNLVASYAGDVDHTASNSAVLIQVMQAATSSAAISSSQNPSTFGDSISFTAIISGTGTQTTGNAVFLDGGATIATVPLNGSGIAVFTTSTLAIGSHTISVNYAGDATHSGAAPASLIQHVLQATSTAVVSSQNPALVGATVRFTATVTGVSGTVPTGTVTFTDGATTLGSAALNAAGITVLDVSTLGAGTHLIAATYSGDANDKVSTSPALSQAINTADTTVTISSSANPSVVGTPVTFTALIVSTGKSANGPVSFLDGSTVLGNVTAVNGKATFTTSALIAGQHAIIARYGGDSGTQVSTSNVLLQVEQQTTTASLSSDTNPALTLQAITLTATVAGGANATGVITFRDGTAIIGSVALNNAGTASLVLPSLSAGTHSLSASYGGDNYNLPSTTNGVSEVVQLRSTTISTTASSSSYLAGQQVTLVGVVHWTGPVTPTGTVTFTSGGATLGTVQVSTAGAATLIFFPQNGSYNIVATYNGDSVYSPSTAASYTITAGASTTFSITANPTTISVTSGDHVGVDVTIVASKSFTDTLAFGCLDMPLDATCTFDKTSMDVTGGGTNTIHLVFDTGNPLGAGATAKLTQRHVSRVAEAGMLLPFAALLGFLLFTSRRRRSLPALLSLAVLILAGLGVTGCANKLQMSTTPAGTYTVRIMASGLHTTASQIADLSVTVR
ncbi:Ig-like domain repeat protein [Terriglobus saanensis]|uniref:Ig-like domain repeat protein n=1 Tax=Terriglobus saanensis TaxID=870903 RepID=UPI00059F79AD|nr:Ig-like domain repeat protein [Terriglobus saanensis]